MREEEVKKKWRKVKKKVKEAVEWVAKDRRKGSEKRRVNGTNNVRKKRGK